MSRRVCYEYDIENIHATDFIVISAWGVCERIQAAMYACQDRCFSLTRKTSQQWEHDIYRKRTTNKSFMQEKKRRVCVNVSRLCVLSYVIHFKEYI